MIHEITSRSNPLIKEIAKLKDKRERDAQGLLLLEGEKMLEMALKSHLVTMVFTLKKRKLPEEVTQYIVNESVLDKLKQSVNPQDVIFVAKKPSSPLNKTDKVLYLDAIQDPGNLGTLLRTALAFSYDLVVLSKDSADPYSFKSVSASKGAIFSLNVVYDDLTHFKDTHDIIVSTLSDDSVDLEELKYKTPFVLVLGNEGHGVSRETLNLASQKVKISISGIESLNVAVAGAILLYKIH